MYSNELMGATVARPCDVPRVIKKQARSIFEFLGAKRALALLSESSEFSVFMASGSG